MNKIIIYGAGKIFWDNIYKFDIHEVICIADKNIFMTPLFGCNIIRPERIPEFEFDYIVIFNKYNCDEIKKNLVAQGIKSDKIISWSYYLYIMQFKLSNVSEYCKKGIDNWLSTFENKPSILDLNQGIVRNCFHKGDSNILERIKLLDTLLCGDEKFIEKSSYNEILLSLDDEKRYDVISCFDYFIEHTFSDFLDFYNRSYSNSKYILMTVPYKGFNPNDASWDDFTINDGVIICIGESQAARLIVIEKTERVNNNDARIYVATHKVFTPPMSSLYCPVFAGSDNNNPMHIRGDKSGDNISELNPLINECTVLYWMWKNTAEEFVGLNHYRRYFSLKSSANPDDFLTESQIIDIMKDSDIIVAPAYDSFPYSLKFQLECSVNEFFFRSGWNAIVKAIKNKHPEYLDDFYRYFDGHFMYPCNMFVMKRPVLNKYCEWLFDILLPACSEFDSTGADSYSLRMIGFIAERLMTLYILHNGIKISEVPMVLI